MKQLIRVLIAEEYRIVRSALRAILELAGDMHVVDEAMEGNEAIQKTIALQPDVLLLDPTLPQQQLSEVIQTLQDQAPTTRVLILAEDWNIYLYGAALAVELAGFMLKTASTKELLMAIRTVHHGGHVAPFTLNHLTVTPPILCPG